MEGSFSTGLPCLVYIYIYLEHSCFCRIKSNCNRKFHKKMSLIKSNNLVKIPQRGDNKFLNMWGQQHQYQNGPKRTKKKKKKTCLPSNVSFVSCQVSGVICHVSHLMCHVSCVACQYYQHALRPEVFSPPGRKFFAIANTQIDKSETLQHKD